MDPHQIHDLLNDPNFKELEMSDQSFEATPVGNKVISVKKFFGPTTSIERRIAQMNTTFNLPCNNFLVDGSKEVGERIKQFHPVLQDEVNELLDCVCPESGEVNMVSLADTLADIVIYAYSEARRHGIPLHQVIHLVLDSQESKLVDGKPLMAEDGSKFIKGPDFQPPEPAIYSLFYDFPEIVAQQDPYVTLALLRDSMTRAIVDYGHLAQEDNPYAQAVIDVAFGVITTIPE